MEYALEKIVPWIYEEDYIYEFGYTNRVFREMSNCGIKNIVVAITPSEETVQHREGCLWIDEWKLRRSIIEVSACCKGLGLRPIFAFECRFVALSSKYLIPKNETALVEFVNYAYMNPICYDRFIEKHRDEFLIGADIAEYRASSEELRPFSYNKYRAKKNVSELYDDTKRCIGQYDFWYADPLRISMQDPDYKTFVTLAESNNITTVLNYDWWYYDDNNHLVVDDFDSEEGIFGSNGMTYLWNSAERLHNAVKIFDAGQVVDSICLV